jgi:antitoxin HigA-1
MFKTIVHPGEILKDELDALEVSLTEFTWQIDVPPNRVSQIIAGKRSITSDTALRFGHWFGVDSEFWLILQAQHDLAIADREVGKVIRYLPTKENLESRGCVRERNRKQEQG